MILTACYFKNEVMHMSKDEQIYWKFICAIIWIDWLTLM